MYNQLKNEKSPYLKQHENNPVQWLAWNSETLEKAKKERKPIFLSIGYASCHWCHVMAHESFEDQETADILNNKFINIKVDREERPDLDIIFQKSLSVLTGAQGGWPLSMFLDENAVPFAGGTYFPPNEINGMPSFKRVLENISKVYLENREKIISQISQLKLVFKDLNRKDAVIKQDLEPYAEKIIQYLDENNGGFKGAPKFPQFYVFQTLLYFFKKNKKKSFFKPVKTLLNKISSKGIYDHLNGGIARYTIDEEWIIPHFEKMLYDNIQYINLLNHYLQIEKSEYLLKKLKQTIEFINNEFLTTNKLVGSAFDADSEGVEGKFYVWNYNELEKILNRKFNIIRKKYNITKTGNFNGNIILVENENINLNKEEQESLEYAEKILLDQRNLRKRPFFDDKIQTDLNCFWFYTNIYSGLLLNDKELIDKTIKSIELLNDYLNGEIFHCYKKDDKEINVFLEDYVYMSLLLITLYEINNNNNALEMCKKNMDKAWSLFFNSDENLLQKNIRDKNDLFVNPIDIFDNNLPNGNSIYLKICNKLRNISGENKWKDRIDILSKSFHSYINYNYSQMFSYLKILNMCEENITVTFHGNINKNKNLINNIILKFMGDVTIIYKPSNENFFSIICKNQTCSYKLKNINEINSYLDKINNV